jgi:Site-specific recombinase XerD
MEVFEVVALQYLENQKSRIKKSSYETYFQWIHNHMIPRFGPLDYTKITKQDIQNFIFDLTTYGRLDGKGGLSCKTIKGIITVFRSILGFAGDYYSRKADTSCLTTLYYPKTSVKLPSIFTQEEQRSLQRIPHSGEKIRSSKVIISTPKSDTSNRIIPLASVLFNAMEKLNYSSRKSYILTGTEHFIESRGYYHFYRKLLENAHISYTIFHTTRHTFATRCIESGADCKTVSELLGHFSVKTTLDLYMHPQLEQKRLCIENMSTVI